MDGIHYGGDIIANNFNVTAGHYFFNDRSATINADNFNVTTDNYTQIGAIDVIGDLRIQVSGEASLDDTASIKARNLFFSAYDLYNQADITITENATFDLENNFLNGFNLDGTAYAGGDIIADSFNVTAGSNFLNRYRATISADSFNVTAGGSLLNRDTARITADNFNVTTGTYFANQYSATINADSFNVTTGTDFDNNNSTINVNDFNVTAGDDFVNKNSATIDADTVTIELTNFDDDIDNTATVSSDSLNFILTDSFTRSSTSFSGFNNFSNLAITTEGTFTNNNAIDLAGNITITANTFINYNSVTAADNLSVVVSNHFTNSASALKANNVDIQATGYIFNSSNAMIEATDNLNIVTDVLFNVAAGATVMNGNVGGNITAANLTIETGAFNNINNDGDINGNINANSFNLSVAGRF